MVDLPTLTPNMAEAQANIISIHYTIHLKNGLSNQHLWQLPLRLVHPSERHFCPGGNGSEGNGGRIGGVDVTKVQNSRRCFHKWMVYKGNAIKIDDLGVSPL